MTDKWTRWKQYRAWRAPSGSDNLGEKTMDSNFGGAYLDECADWRNRYYEANENRMKTNSRIWLDQLNREIAGWIIVRVDDNQQDEEIFTLVVAADGNHKSIQVCATDLGWWIGKIWKEAK